MRYVIAFFFLISGTSCFAQFVLKGTVLDSMTKKPIPYSLVTTNSGKQGTISNGKGEFELTLPDSLKTTFYRFPVLVLTQPF